MLCRILSLCGEPTHALKSLSAVQIINANSVPADLASLLLAALSSPNLQSRSQRDVLLPVSSVILRAQRSSDLGSVSALPKNLCITNPVKPIDH